MSIRIMKLVRQTDLPHFERYVLWTLADYANDDGCDIWPALSRIMADTGLSNGTVNRALASLKRRGVLLNVRGGRGLSS